VGLVRSGASVVCTKRSGALLKCALGCALLAHFASKDWSSQAKCALKIRVHKPSVHLKVPQTDFATCALPKYAGRAQKSNICALLAHFVFCFGIILVVSVVLFIASYCWTQISQSLFCQ
jgi:hypothetical protein